MSCSEVEARAVPFRSCISNFLSEVSSLRMKLSTVSYAVCVTRSLSSASFCASLCSLLMCRSTASISYVLISYLSYTLSAPPPLLALLSPDSLAPAEAEAEEGVAGDAGGTGEAGVEGAAAALEDEDEDEEEEEEEDADADAGDGEAEAEAEAAPGSPDSEGGSGNNLGFRRACF